MDRRDFMKLGALAMGAPMLLAERKVRASGLAYEADKAESWRAFKLKGLGERPVHADLVAEVLRHDEFVPVGSYKDLMVGDVFRSRQPDGAIEAHGTDDELFIVLEAPERVPLYGYPEYDTWSVFCDRWCDFAKPLEAIDWSKYGLSRVYLNSGPFAGNLGGIRQSWPRLFLLDSRFAPEANTTNVACVTNMHLVVEVMDEAFDVLSKAYPNLPWNRRVYTPTLGVMNVDVHGVHYSEPKDKPTRDGVPTWRGLEPRSEVCHLLYSSQRWFAGPYVDPGVYISEVIVPTKEQP